MAFGMGHTSSCGGMARGILGSGSCMPPWRRGMEMRGEHRKAPNVVLVGEGSWETTMGR